MFKKIIQVGTALLIILAVTGCNLKKTDLGPNPFSSKNNQLVISKEIKSEERFACISKSSATKTYVTVKPTDFYTSCDGVKAAFVKIFNLDDYSTTDMSKDITINGYQRNAWSKYKMRIALLDRVRLDIEYQQKLLNNSDLFKLYASNALYNLELEYKILEANNGPFYTPVNDVDEIWKSVSYNAGTARTLAQLENTGKSSKVYELCANLTYSTNKHDINLEKTCSNDNINIQLFNKGRYVALLDTILDTHSNLEICKRNEVEFNKFADNRISVNPDITDLTGFYHGSVLPYNDIKITKFFDSKCDLSKSSISATIKTRIKGYEVERNEDLFQELYSDKNVVLNPKVTILRRESSMIHPQKKYQDNNISVTLHTIDKRGSTNFKVSNNTNSYLNIKAISLYLGNKILTNNKVMSLPPQSEKSTYQDFDLPYDVKNNFFPRAGFNKEMASKNNKVGISILYSFGGSEFTLHSTDTMSFFDLM